MRIAVGLLILVAGCAPPPPPSRAQLKDHVEVPTAGPLEPNAVWFTFTKEGIWRNGVAVTLEAIPEGSPPEPRTAGQTRREPVLLEIAPEATLREISPLLERLISFGRCTNLGFVVASGGTLGTVYLPVEVAHGCQCLAFWDGPDRYNEHSESLEIQHLWIVAELKGPGIEVTTVRTGMKDSIVFSDSGEPNTLTRNPWEEPHPALGAWSEATLTAFWQEPRVQSLRPFVQLIVKKDSRMGDVISNLALLKKVAPGRVVVDIPAR